MFDGVGILATLVDVERQNAQLAAVKLGWVARFMALDSDEFASLELGAVMGWSPLYTQSQIRLATALTTRFPATFAALSAGGDSGVQGWSDRGGC
jgi:hypothetical protein